MFCWPGGNVGLVYAPRGKVPGYIVAVLGGYVYGAIVKAASEVGVAVAWVNPCFLVDMFFNGRITRSRLAELLGDALAVISEPRVTSYVVDLGVPLPLLAEASEIAVSRFSLFSAPAHPELRRPWHSISADGNSWVLTRVREVWWKGKGIRVGKSVGEEHRASWEFSKLLRDVVDSSPKKNAISWLKEIMFRLTHDFM